MANDRRQRSTSVPSTQVLEHYAAAARLSGAYLDLFARGMSLWGGSSTPGASPTAAPIATPSGDAPTNPGNPLKPPTRAPSQPSNYPVVFDKPIVPDPYIETIPLSPERVTLSSGAEVVVPFRFWRTQALLLTGSADIHTVQSILKPHGETAIAHPDTGAATIHLYAPNYAGTSLGAVPALFASILVHNTRRFGSDSNTNRNAALLDGEFFWMYRTPSPVNHLFKREIWGIHSELADLSFDYLRPTKAVALLENGRNAFTMLWRNPKALSEIVHIPGEQRFVSVTPYPLRSHYLTRFRGQMIATGMDETGQPCPGIPFEAGIDSLRLDEHSTFGAGLRSVGFKPLHWNFYSDYGGVVEIPPTAGRR